MKGYMLYDQYHFAVVCLVELCYRWYHKSSKYI